MRSSSRLPAEQGVLVIAGADTRMTGARFLWRPLTRQCQMKRLLRPCRLKVRARAARSRYSMGCLSRWSLAATAAAFASQRTPVI
jgi:hypothetical protein